MPRKTHPVKVAIAARGETQTELARAVGVSPGTMSGVLNDHVRPWPALRRRVADHLGVPAADLFTDADEHADPITDPATLARVAALASGGASDGPR
jgi:transcriptional regulator with XRE-family HTH domain